MLSDQQKRAAYDRFGHDAFTNGGGGGQGQSGFQQVDLSDLFGEMFGFGDLFGNAGGRGGRRSRAQRGADLREDLTITFENAAFGVEKEVTIRRHELCDACHGTGAAGGKAPSQCRQCNGHGQVRYQQGFFSVARTCPVCQGTGTMIENPCTTCKGQRSANPHSHPAGESAAGRGGRNPHSLHRTRRRRTRWRACRRRLRCAASDRASVLSSATARICIAPSPSRSPRPLSAPR